MNTILLVELFLKSTAILAAGFGAAAFLAKSSAAHRSLVWLGVFAVLLLLPLAVVIRPAWTLPVAVEAASAALEAGGIAGSTAPLSDTLRQTASWRPVWSAGQSLLACYLAGIAAVLGFRLMGSCQIGILSRSSVEDPAATSMVNAWLKASRIRRPVRAFTSARVTVPMTWGIWRPVIVLPDNCRDWTDERLHAALRHEFAHIRHGDAARRWLGTAVCAFWWPHPLVWVAFRRWKLEQECACDDAVLADGGDAADYAQQLIGAARAARLSGSQSAAALVMAGPSGLETRLRSVLNGTMDRSAVRKSSLVGVGVMTLLAAAGGVALQAQSVPAVTGEHPAVTSNPGPGVSVVTMSVGNGTVSAVQSGRATQSTANPPVSKQVTVMSQVSSTAPAPSGQAATVLALSPEELAHKTIIKSVTFEDVLVGEALQFVGKLSGIKVRYAVPAKDDPRVTMRLKDVPAHECFQYIATIANLTVTYDDGGACFEPKK